MEKEVKDFLTAITKIKACDIRDVMDRATELLYEDFKKEVRELWKYNLTCSSAIKETRDFYKKTDRADFVVEQKYYEDRFEFVNEHWNEIDKIIQIIREYIEELEQQEKEEK